MMKNNEKIRNPKKYINAKIAQFYHKNKKPIYALKSSNLLPIFDYKQFGLTLKSVKSKLQSYRPRRNGYRPHHKEEEERDILHWQDQSQRWFYHLNTNSIMIRKDIKIPAKESQLLKTCDRRGISKYYLYEYWEDLDWDYYSRSYRYPKVWGHRHLHVLGIENLNYLKRFNHCHCKLGVDAFLRFSTCKYDLKSVRQVNKTIRKHEIEADDKIAEAQDRLSSYVKRRGFYTKFYFMDVG